MTKEKDFNHIKEWLQPLLDAKGMSVEQLARAASVTRTTLYFYLSDKRRPDTQTMMRICDALGVPHEEGLSKYTVRPEGRRKGYKP